MTFSPHGAGFAAPDVAPDDLITRKLIAWKDALIDQSRRNPLIHLPAKSVVRLDTAMDTPDALWNLPSAGVKRLWLMGKTLPESDITRTLKSRERAFAAPEMRTLANLRLKARLSLNEQGVNVLFLAVGVLCWRDPRLNADLRSPLLLLPVALEKTPMGDGFILGRFDEDARVNPTLRHRLGLPDVRLALPVLDGAGGDEDDLTPSAYLAQVTELIKERPGWRVEAAECLLGRFSYLNLAMYEELSTRLAEVRRHPLIAAIAGDTNAASGLLVPDTPPLDFESPQMTYHVLPADPSQERAVSAARYGQSLVIQGPPGTGKTQTITNLIATCIADGKRVLFVSEKMAALEAVYSRLHECGLSNLCLEAHSHKASKQAVLEQLRQTLDDTTRDVASQQSKMSVLATLRDDLNRAVAALHKRREPLGMSVYEARGVVAELADTPDVYFALDLLEDTDADDFHRMESLAERLSHFHDLFPQTETHPWRGIRASRYSQELHVRVRDAVSDQLQTMDGLENHADALWRLLDLPPRPSETIGDSDAEWLLYIAARLQDFPRPPAPWLTGGDDVLAALRNQAVETQARFRAFLNEKEKLLAAFSETVLELSHAELGERLQERNSATLLSGWGTDWADISDADYARADTAIDAALQTIARLGNAARQTAQDSGLPAPFTLAQHRTQEGALRLATETDPRPQAGWFAPNALTNLRKQAKATEARQTKRNADRAHLAPIYTNDLYALPLEELHARFKTEYASWTRVFKGAFWADLKKLKTVLQTSASLKGRDIEGDLARARSTRDLERDLEADDDALRAAFGSHHWRGDETNWAVLSAALDQTDSLARLLNGQIPFALQQILISSGAALASLAQQRGLFAARLDEADNALGNANKQVRLGGADTRPLAQTPLSEIAGEYEAAQTALRDFVAARQTVRETHLRPGSVRTGELRSGLTRAAHVVAEEAAIARESDELRVRYAHLFDGLQTDWNAVLAALDHAERLRRAFADANREIPAIVVAAASGSGDAPLAHAAASEADKIVPLRAESARVWRELGELFETAFLRKHNAAQALNAEPFAVSREWAETRIAALGQLERWLQFQTVLDDGARQGLLSFCEVMTRRRPPAELIAPIFRKAFHQRWLDAIAAAAPELSTLCEAEHRGRSAKFEQLDRAAITGNPARIRAIMTERRELALGMGGKAGELGALRRILTQKRPRASVRKILGDIPNLLFRLKPCLMMSPLSVSLFLDPDRIQFDIVIFDEASQIFPEYALGPLMRADQAVIAGDSKQLPPTAFFKGMQDGADDDEEDEEAATAGDAREFESVLDAATVPLAETPLTWHYRSRHESLITFSNTQYYHGKLKTFPSARTPSAVSFVYVEDGVYYGGTGKARNNPLEAKRIADLVIRQIREYPKLSLGVITMSEAQQECVRAEIERRTASDTTLAGLLSEERNAASGFFIKNIENVQGDERDVIFLSVGYGKWEDGRARMLFGPLNRAGGERRLNVAITRAKEKLTVVSSLLPEEIRLSDTASNGARSLREYLAFARSSEVTIGANAASATDPADPLADAVARALRARGHTVRQGVGLSDYRLDLAIADPNEPDALLLGIECDSVNYQSGETARAREWLRAGVLRGLGWRLFRLWSADWVRDRDAVLVRIEQALKGEVPDAPSPVDIDVSAAAETGEAIDQEAIVSETGDKEAAANAVNGNATPGATRNGLLPGLVFYADAPDAPLDGGAFTLYDDAPASALLRAEFVYQIVQIEAPVASGVLALRLSRAADLQRAGAKIKNLTVDALTMLEAARKIERRDDFVFLAGEAQTPARVPAPGANPRPVEQISVEEIAEVAVVVLRHAVGMGIDEAVSETARILGYGRTGTMVQERIASALARLEYDNRLQNFRGQLRPLDE